MRTSSESGVQCSRRTRSSGLTDSNNPDYAGTNGTKLANYTIDVPVPPYLNTTYDYLIVAAVPYVAGVSGPCYSLRREHEADVRASGATGIRYFNSSILITQPPTADSDADSISDAVADVDRDDSSAIQA
jgi:hypothetical protein